MTPNYERAASLALITLNTNHITATPVSALADFGSYMEGYEE